MIPPPSILRAPALALVLAGAAACAPPAGEQAAGDPRALLAQEIAPLALPRGERPSTLAERLAENVDPARDGWDTEVLSDAVGERLKALAQHLQRPAAAERTERLAAELAAWVDPGFAGTALLPADLRVVQDDAPFTVRRGASPPATTRRGPAGLARALAELAEVLGGGEPHVKLKLVGIERGATDFTTEVRYEAGRAGGEHAVQQTARWRARWSYPAAGGGPRLLGLELLRYEEVEAGGALFGDCTAAALGADPSYRRQVLPGIDHWLPRVSLLAGMSLVGHHGLAVGDADGDGLEDLYVCDAAGLPNRLYLQNADGTARDVAAAAGVDWLEPSSSALFVDLDGDGDQDLAVATRRRLLLSENDGGGRFTLRASLHDVVTSSSSLSAADYDQDGDLDLYLCAYDGDAQNQGLPGPVPYHDARNGGANVLLANGGDFRFADATAAAGLDHNNDRFSFAAAWEDYDNDGDLDLYVANDFGRNNLYENDGGRFTDVAARAGVEDVAAGMSAAWGDYDRDGWMDLYVSNMFSAAGNRIAYQRRFADAARERAADLQRMARGNTLFRNAGDGRFDDVSLEAGVTMGRWAWGSRFADLTNDGWPDLVVANGYVTGSEPADL
ncbi:MAG: VCBS repeat-containing protein [Acidobacteria bacterium]|nr:MAG: VCBS repeat-containing protein [Acidobacteriota bacterium]